MQMKFLAVRSAGYTQKTVFHVLSSIDCNCEAAVRNAVTSGILLSVFFGASQPASATYAPPVPCACARVDLMIICMADQLSVEVKRGDMRRAASCFQRLFSAAGCVSKAGAADGNQGSNQNGATGRSKHCYNALVANFQVTDLRGQNNAIGT